MKFTAGKLDYISGRSGDQYPHAVVDLETGSLTGMTLACQFAPPHFDSPGRRFGRMASGRKTYYNDGTESSPTRP